MKHSLPLTLMLVVAFVIAQLVGLAIVNSYIDPVASAEAGQTEFSALPALGNVALERPDVEESVSWAYIIGAILVGTILLLILIKYAQVWLWKIWFFSAVALSLYIAFAAFLFPWLAGVAALAFGVFKLLKPESLWVVFLQNLAELFIYGGLAAIFVPIFDLLSIALLLIAISAYDMYAVWQSKHMVKMAKFQTNSGVFAGLSIPYGFKKSSGSKAKSKSKSSRSAKTAKSTKSSKKSSEGSMQTAFLGGGDVAIPLLFTGTVLKVFGLTPALIIVPFSTLALFLLLYYAKQDKFYPAMPFLSGGCFVGLAFAYLFTIVV